jgi:hypothetical protein
LVFEALASVEFAAAAAAAAGVLAGVEQQPLA